MTDRGYRAGEPFRLNLEQQKKRAKELLKDLKQQDAAALERFQKHHPNADAPVLADAQLVIARELGLPSWPRLKAHIEAMQHQREVATPLDAEMPTLHVRCGSDIGPTLKEAGFKGDFLEYSDALGQGPVDETQDFLETRAQFLTDAYGPFMGVTFESTLRKLRRADERLANASRDYARIVLWMEHDAHDQLVLCRCLAQFAMTGAPNRTELVIANRFPGAARFIGLGQLPPEALRLLWAKRQSLRQFHFALGHRTWQALKAGAPQGLAAIALNGTPALPDLAPAMIRHLQELPSTRNGLGLTEQLTLEILTEGDRSFGETFRLLMREREPLPWLGDVMYRHILQRMASAADPIITIIPKTPSSAWHDCHLAITPTGRRVVAGDLDWLACGAPERWLGGISIKPGAPCWRWDDVRQTPSLV